MQNGIYKASFAVGPNYGDGIVVVRDGYLAGGDYGFTYEGSYTSDGNKVQGTVSINQWDSRAQNVFQGLTNFELTFSGSVQGQGWVLERFPADVSRGGIHMVADLIQDAGWMEAGMDGQAVVDGPAVASARRG